MNFKTKRILAIHEYLILSEKERSRFDHSTLNTLMDLCADISKPGSNEIITSKISIVLADHFNTDVELKKFLNRMARFKSDKNISPTRIKIEPNTNTLLTQAKNSSDEYETYDDVIFEALLDLKMKNGF